jgi:hypothetical protein
MNGTTTAPAARSVQLAVMAAPSASVAEAVAEARRRHDPSGAWISRPAAEASIHAQLSAT